MKIIISDVFEKWLESIKDKKTKVIIETRVKKITVYGHTSDYKSVGEKVFESRIHFGGGIRIYYSILGDVIVLLLNGGDKSTQKKDIKKAIELLKEFKGDKDET